MKPTYVFVLLACILTSCNSIKSLSVKEGTFPLIGTIGKEQGNLLKTEFRPIGYPVLDQPIALTAQSVPFSKSAFKSYQYARELSGAKSTIDYVDSVKTKPSYMLISITDRIGLRETLNNEDNHEVKSYLEKDPNYRLVSSISVVLDSKSVQELQKSDGLFLGTDGNGLLQIEVIQGSQRRMIPIPKNEIFSYDLIGFCWGKTRYGKPVIETFNDSGRCPEGTANDPKNLNELQSYLKL